MDYGWQENIESWIPIPKTPYEISNKRRIRRLCKYRGKKLDPHYLYLKVESNVITLQQKKFNVDKLMLELWGVEFVKDIDGEEWLDIKGHETAYQISSFGRIRSKARYVERKDGKRLYKKPQIIKDCSINSGYKMVRLHDKDGVTHKVLVHRLVAEHFIPNPNGLEQVNHKDENKHNNNAQNLEWCTREYNNRYGTSQERRKATRLKNNGGVYYIERKNKRN